MTTHTRFATGARKGAGSLSISAVIAFAVAMAAANAAAVNNGVAVTTLPEPDGSGAYVFGNANYPAALFFDSDLPAGLAYPVWSDIAVPSGSTVKFVGGIALSSLPEGCACDFSGCRYALVTDASVFGAGFTVPETTTLLFLRCNVTVDGSVASFATPANTGTIGVPFVLNGTNTVGKNRGNLIFNGAVTGA